jgi:carbamoyltransferase
MGLAPYGEPRFMAEMRQIVKIEEDGAFRLNLDYFRHHREKIAYEWENGEPSFSSLYSPRLAELLGPARKPEDELTQRHKDIARSVQAMYEEAFFHLLNRLHERYRVDALARAHSSSLSAKAVCQDNFRRRRHTPAARSRGVCIEVVPSPCRRYNATHGYHRRIPNHARRAARSASRQARETDPRR